MDNDEPGRFRFATPPAHHGFGSRSKRAGDYTLPNERTQTFRILSLDGGGYLGLATAAYLAELERHFDFRFADRFDMFCGTSTGAIIALGLAKGLSAKEIKELYTDLGAKVFWNPVPGFRLLRFVRGIFVSRYGNGQLAKCLGDAFGTTTLGETHDRGKHALVPAFCVTSGRPRIFKTDHHHSLTTDSKYRLADVALASASAPTYLPLFTLRSPEGVSHRYCDGGLFANHPALIGYTEAVSVLRKNPAEIQLLSVSTPRSDLSEGDARLSWLQRFLLHRGLFGWASKLASIMIDATSEVGHQTVKRLAGTAGARYERVELREPAKMGMAIDDASMRVTNQLLRIGNDAAVQNDMRDRISPFIDRVK
jgi:predicted acylesterase/phospholipase RssA